MSELQKPPRVTSQIVVLAFSIALVLYVGSYYYLSRKGMREAAAMHMEGCFFYTRLDEIPDKKNLAVHFFCVPLFAPINWIDRTFFGGPSPPMCVMFDLS